MLRRLQQQTEYISTRKEVFFIWFHFEVNFFYRFLMSYWTLSYTKFELNMLKYVGEKCGKLHISKSLKLKRNITPAKSDGN